MNVIDFVASPPAENGAMQKLRDIQGTFNLVADTIRTAGPLPITRENQDEIANKTGADRFMVEDLISALLDQASPPFSEFIGQGFWTFGRQAPRYGTPWGDLVFYDTSQSVELLVRYRGSFDDEEETRKWVSCPLTSMMGTSYGDLTTMAANCKTLDIWWKLDQNKIVGKLVFK